MADLKTMREYSTVEEPAFSEIVIKKSRFIGQIYPAKSFEEAGELILASKKKYWDAGHGCTAMIFGLDRSLMRCSDAGEPQGTAGVPMLEVLKGSGLTNLLMISTRYFGGTLLGAGGLVRAYTKGAKIAIDAAGKSMKRVWSVLYIPCPYTFYERLKLEAAAFEAVIRDTQFGAEVELEILVAEDKAQAFLDAVTELTAGTVEGLETAKEYRAFPVTAT